MSVERAYNSQYRHNEQKLLQSLVDSGRASVAYPDPKGRFTVFDIRNFSSEQSKPASLDQCGIY